MTAPADRPDDIIRDWFANLYAGVERGWLTLFALDRHTGARITRWAAVDDLELAAAHAAELTERCCVWFGAATRHAELAGGKRGGAADCAEIPAVWLDVDVAGPNHAAANLPATFDEARSLVDDFAVPPTALVASGGGLQAWWALAEPLPAADAAGLLARWGATWEQAADRRGWHLDNVFDVARIMRLPGTVNRKTTPTPVTVVHADWTRRYGVDDLDQWLVDPPTPPEPERRTATPYIGPRRPGDAFSAVVWPGDLLAEAGFRLQRRDRNGDEHWTGPWKEPRDGASATVYANDRHCTIWSDTATTWWPAVETRRPYDAFGLYTVLFHAGDWADATRALSERGYGEAPVDVAGWLDTIERSRPDTSDDDWPEPVPFADTDVDPFPLDVLPAWIADYCATLADELQVPVDLCGQMALGAWSAACAGKAKITVAGRWTEHVNLFVTAVMPSGAGKSPVAKRLAAPLRALEHEQADQMRKEIAEAKAARKKAEAAVKDAEKSGDVARIAHAYLQLDAADVPSAPRLVVDDVTQEMLAVLLGRHGGRMALISTEATMFDMACGLYAGTSRRTNNNVYLQGWSADPLVIDRKGSSAGDGTEIKIDEPVLTVAITVQPSTIAELRKHPELAGRGFTARFMYAMPDPLVGRRNRRRILDDTDTDTAERYNDTFLAAARRYASFQTPMMLRASRAAAEAFVDWLEAMEPMLGEGGELDAVSEWTAKLQASVARVAGLLHLADGHDHRREVDEATMRRAIRLGDYWTSHALAIAGLWELDDIAALAKRIVGERFATGEVDEFDSGDLHQRWHRRRLTSIADDAGEDVATVTHRLLCLLADHGYIRPADGGPVQRLSQGKARQRFVVSPRVIWRRCNRPDNARNARDARKRDVSLSLSPSISPPQNANRARYARYLDSGDPPARYLADDTPPSPQPTGWLWADSDDPPDGAA